MPLLLVRMYNAYNEYWKEYVAPDSVSWYCAYVALVAHNRYQTNAVQVE